MTKKLLDVRTAVPVAAVALSLSVAACASAPRSLPPSPAVSSPATTNANVGRGPAGVHVADLDRRADPCTDFYQFANGRWRADHPIPEGKPRWSRRAETREANARHVQELVAEISARRDWPTGSPEQLVGDHYASCMDEARIDAAGVTPLAPVLAEIERSRSNADVQRAIRAVHQLSVPAVFGTSADFDFRDPARTVANVLAAPLGLVEPEAYLSQGGHAEEIRGKYRAHVERLLHLGGMTEARAAKAGESILALETRLARASLTTAAASDPAALSHPMTFAQLRQLAPHVEWDAYFAEAGLPRTDLNVADPKLLQAVDGELSTTPVAVWKAYLAYLLLDSASPWLARDFAQESFDFHERDLGGASAQKPRAQLCTESTDALLGDALGRKYVERYFPPAAKAKVQEIIQNLRTALAEHVAKVAWMVPETRAKALAMVAAYNPQVGYPDHWKDYSGLTIRRDDFWANVASARRFSVRDNRARAGKPTARDQWSLDASSSDAYILPELDQMVLPAGFLQPPAFDLSATDAVNYGAIGTGVAHDMTHAVDASGALVDIHGRHERWWTDADQRQFDARAQCVIDQYEGYVVEPGLHEDGRRVESEAIGDQAGVQLALQALQGSMKSHPVAVTDGFTPEQQFFLSYGQYRGDAIRIDAQRKIVATDIHAITRFRVNGPLSNCPDFQTAFACKAEAPMVRTGAARCSVW